MMILLAKDYVLHLKKCSRVLSDGRDPDNEVILHAKGTPKCSQLLASLRDDLRCATNIFIEEFSSAGGVESLLDFLRVLHTRLGESKAPRGRQEQTLMRKMSSNQYECLMCLKYAMQNMGIASRVTEDAHGLSTIAACIMSTYPKSRILALQLLSRSLEISDGHSRVSEAMTAVRLLFGEPVRFKFLMGLVRGGTPAFQSAALRFLNALLRSSPREADRVRLQCELEEAGLDVDAIEEDLRTRCVPCTESVWAEIKTWRSSYVDMERVTGTNKNLETENERLQKEVQLLRQALQKLEEDKINLMQIEMELKEKCEDLNEEVTTLKSEIKKPVPVIESKHSKSHLLDADEDDPFLTGQLGTEEIFIDVPTIRPPVGFRSDSSSICENPSPSLSTKTKSETIPYPISKTNSSSTSTTGFCSKASNSDKESADSALSESESESGIQWSYPNLPKPLSRESRLLGVYNPGGHKFVHRSRSEDRRGTQDLPNGETKTVDCSNFIMTRRPRLNSNWMSGHTGYLDSNVPKHAAGKSVIPSYQLPIAYRSNFLIRGHSNCDLYSGITNEDKIPTIPPPDYTRGFPTSGGTISTLVHKEITKAVKQIGGWI